MKLPARLLAAAISLAALLGAGSAAARPRHHAGHAAPSYPMKAAEFRALAEKRIDHVRAVIDKKLDRRGVSPDRKKAIHKIFDEASRDLRAEIARAAADGTVTEVEGAKVKALTTGLRAKVRERLRAEKNPLARAKLEKAEAAREAKAAKREKAAGADASGKEKGGAKAAKKDHHAKAPPTKAAKADAHKKAGTTRPAKAAAGKKHKHAEDTSGENL